MDYTVDAFEHLGIGGVLRVGEGPHFDATAPQVGDRVSYRQTVRLQVGPSLSTSLLWQMERVSEKGSGRTLINRTIFFKVSVGYRWTAADAAAQAESSGAHQPE